MRPPAREETPITVVTIASGFDEEGGRWVQRAAAHSVVACLHELAITLSAARHGSAAWRGSLGFLRERRALGLAVEAGPAGRRYVVGTSPRMEGQRRALALLLVSTAAAVLLTVVILGPQSMAGAHAFLANLFDDLGRWWNGLSWWQQTAVIVGVAALLTFGGMGFFPALNLVTTASSVATYGQGLGTLLRDPRQATTEYLRNLTPAEAAVQLAGAALNRALPAAAGGAAGREIRREVLNQAEQAAVNRSRSALGRAMAASTEVNGPVGARRGGRVVKAAASDSERTLSGWKQPRPPGFVDASPEQVRDLSTDIGHRLGRSGGRDQISRGGFEGKYQASHAEKQLAVRRPNEPIAVSEPMCADCTSFYQRLAIYRNRPQIVTDPNVTYVFRPDGTVDRVAEEPL